MNFFQYLEKWNNVNLGTVPLDRYETKCLINAVYESCELPVPKIVWCDSPFRMAVDINKRGRKFTLDNIAGNVVFQQHWEKIWVAIRNVATQPFFRWEPMIAARLWGFTEQIRDVVNLPRGFSNIFPFLTSSLRDFIWLDYVRSELNFKKETEWVAPIIELCKNPTWSVGTKYMFYISERPEAVEVDDTGRLHSENGPALAYSDNFAIYSIHGVTVPKQVVMHPKSQAFSKIRNEKNMEIKRIRIERYGWENYLNKVHARVIDARRNDVECTHEALMQTKDMMILVCHCPSTGRVYTMEVPMTTKTCQEAQEFLWAGGGLSKKKLNILGRS